MIDEKVEARGVELGVQDSVKKIIDARIEQQPPVDPNTRQMILKVDNLKMYFPVTKGLL